MRKYAIVPVEKLEELERTRVELLKRFPYMAVCYATSSIYYLSHRKWFTFSWFK